ncbi:MAG TPA: penicillin-binding protein 1A [Rickettsiales bacterium]|nr:penicillin-binding protein 1A [Rickettsiales bacterium]
MAKLNNFFIRLLVGTVSTAFTVLVIGMLLVIGLFFHYSSDLPDYRELAKYDPETTTRLYAADGKLMAEYAMQKRVFIPFKYMPKRLVEAFISAEDKNFYSNNGIDVYGIARASLQNIEGLLGHGHLVSGGSTITQQVVKNFLLTPEKSLARKVKEAILAYRITQVYSKDRIMELYLNEIYLGKGSYGVAAAALNYFNKPLDDLNIEETAFLAAMPQAPGRSDPAQHYERAKERRDYVINRMLDDGYITAAEARAAIAQPITLKVRDKAEIANADFFSEEVRREIAAKYGNDTLYKGGLYIKTTLNPTLQEYADAGLRYALQSYDHRHGYRGPIAHMQHFQHWQKDLDTIEVNKRIPLFDGERLSLVADVAHNKVTVYFSNNTKGTLDKDSLKWTHEKGLAIGDVIIVAPTAKKEVYEVHQIPAVNGALIVMDPYNGRVLAMSGGYSYGGTEFNRATQARRQPGSSFKPFVYLTAMENGFTPASIVVDAPVEISQGSGMPVWKPENYHGGYLGPATLRTALEKSRNAMTVRLAQMLGLDKIIELGKRFGIYDKLPNEFSLVLGAQETTLIRLANAYSMLDNGGKRVSPWMIDRIDDKTGKTIFRHDTRPCTGCLLDGMAQVSEASKPPVLPDNRVQIADNRAVYQIVSMMQGVVEHGTGYAAHKLGKVLAGKTGTTNDSKDTWFIGFSPDLVAGIYVGYDQPKTLGRRETGASVALPGFIKFMEQALKEEPSKPFNVPPGITFAPIDILTGLPPIPGTTDRIVMEAFKENEVPGQGGEEVPKVPDSQKLQPQPGAPDYTFPSEQQSAPPPAEYMPKPDSSTYGGAYLPPSRYERRGSEGTGGLY